MAAALLIAGFCALVTGVAFVFWPAALIVAGVLLIVAGLDLVRPEKTMTIEEALEQLAANR